jgi:hypothetical protein
MENIILNGISIVRKTVRRTLEDNIKKKFENGRGR